MASQKYPGLNLYEKMRESELPGQELAFPIKNQQSVSKRFLQVYLKKKLSNSDKCLKSINLIYPRELHSFGL